MTGPVSEASVSRPDGEYGLWPHEESALKALYLAAKTKNLPLWDPYSDLPPHGPNGRPIEEWFPTWESCRDIILEGDLTQDDWMRDWVIALTVGVFPTGHDPDYGWLARYVMDMADIKPMSALQYQNAIVADDWSLIMTGQRDPESQSRR